MARPATITSIIKINLDDIVQHEVSHEEKLYESTHMRHLKQFDSKTENRIIFVKGQKTEKVVTCLMSTKC